MGFNTKYANSEYQLKNMNGVVQEPLIKIEEVKQQLEKEKSEPKNMKRLETIQKIQSW